MVKVVNKRRVEHNCNNLFPKRWSPRAMSGKKISDDELMTLFEAARWAPSAFNHQPWRFVYAKRNTKDWDRLFGLLAEPNQAWCKNAAVLVVVVSQEKFEYNKQPNRSHAFSTGSAFENIALQGSMKGLVVHGMAGFDYDRAKKELKVTKG